MTGAGSAVDQVVLRLGGETFKEGDYLSINGTVGNVYAGQIPTAPSEIVQVLIDKTLDPKKSETYSMFKTLMDWCAKSTRLQVRTNADTPEQTENAVAFAKEFCLGQGRVGDQRAIERICRVNRLGLDERLVGTVLEPCHRAHVGAASERAQPL